MTSQQTQQQQTSSRNTFTSPCGVPMSTYTTFEAQFQVHPDHVGFIVGRGGSTIKGVASRFKVDARTRNSRDGAWPKIVIRGQMVGVEGAYTEIRKIANIANEKIPRIFNQTKSSPPPPLKMDGDKSNTDAHQEPFVPKSPDYTPSSPAYVPTEPAPSDSGNA